MAVIGDGLNPAEFMIQYTAFIQVICVLLCAMFILLLAALQPTFVRAIVYVNRGLVVYFCEPALSLSLSLSLALSLSLSLLSPPSPPSLPLSLPPSFLPRPASPCPVVGAFAAASRARAMQRSGKRSLSHNAAWLAQWSADWSFARLSCR